MTVTVKQLIPARTMQNALTTEYTAVNCVALIDKATLTNEAAANALVSVHIVIAGGTADASNRIIKDRAIAPGEAYTCPELVGHSVSNGGFISMIAGAAGAITVLVSGREIT